MTSDPFPAPPAELFAPTEPLARDAPALVARPQIDPTKLDPEAVRVISRLRQRGYQAYLVGGCVRDLLLGRTPKDFDLATSAHPAQVKATFNNCRLIGRRFRLAHVYFKGGKVLEVATFRANPTEVEELSSPEESAEVQSSEPEDLLITQDNVFGTAEQDARRRDFTINGLFYDVAAGKVIDYVNGIKDLEARQIRTIGDPEIRMREDPVRILRAVRFACKLDLDIESRTYAAMEGAVEDLPRCAPPRLLEETFRLLRAGVAAPSLKLLNALDALKFLLPPIYEYIRSRGPEQEETLLSFARALDRRVEQEGPLEDAILLAALLLPISKSAPESQGEEEVRPRIAQAVEDLLSQMTQGARLPRRIAQRCRMILLAQSTLSGERRRRRSLASFRRFPLFAEALVVFEISVEATGQHADKLEAWKAGNTPPVPAQAPTASRPRRRRRRRSRKPGHPSASGAAPAESKVSGP